MTALPSAGRTDYRTFYRGRRVVVTGGLGFIGSNLARRLVEEGLARRAEIQVSYAIGRAEPVSVSVELPSHTRFVELKAQRTDRPDLQTAARVRRFAPSRCGRAGAPVTRPCRRWR